MEIIVVMAILALAAAMVGPAITSGIKSTKLQTTSRTASALMRLARTKAATLKQTMATEIDLETRLLAVHPMAVSPEERGTAALNAVETIALSLPEGIQIEEVWIGEEKAADDATRFVILFYPDGRSTGGQIFFQDDRGRQLCVVVDRITGNTDIREPQEVNRR